MTEFTDRVKSILGFSSAILKAENAAPTRVPQEQTLLPWDVRYALKHRGGMLDRTEIKILAHNPAYLEAAFYLSARALRHDPQLQRAHIARYVDNLMHNEGDQGKLTAELLSSIDVLPADLKVDATKLAEISRQSPRLRTEAYGLLARDIKSENLQPVLVAHAALEGLHTFLPVFPHLRAVSPHWFGREGFPIGYSIETRNGSAKVSFLQDKSDLPPDAVFVDDTLNQGGTQDTVNTFMGAPTDFRVINKVPG